MQERAAALIFSPPTPSEGTLDVLALSPLYPYQARPDPRPGTPAARRPPARLTAARRPQLQHLSPLAALPGLASPADAPWATPGVLRDWVTPGRSPALPLTPSELLLGGGAPALREGPAPPVLARPERPPGLISPPPFPPPHSPHPHPTHPLPSLYFTPPPRCARARAPEPALTLHAAWQQCPPTPSELELAGLLGALALPSPFVVGAALPSPAGSPPEAPGVLAPPAPWQHVLPLPWADAHSPALSAQVRAAPRPPPHGRPMPPRGGPAPCGHGRGGERAAADG